MDQPRNATVRAKDRVEVYTVDRATFDRYKTVSRPFIDRILENFRADGGMVSLIDDALPDTPIRVPPSHPDVALCGW